MWGVDLPAPPSKHVQPHPSEVWLTLARPPMARANGSGILTGFPSPTPFGLGLGTDLPCADRLDAGNLRLTARGVLTRVIATYADKVFSDRFTEAHTLRYGRPFRCRFTATECSPTIHTLLHESETSVHSLSPVILSAQGCLTSELLRFL